MNEESAKIRKQRFLQNPNRRVRKSKHTAFSGVTYNSKAHSNAWMAQMNVGGKVRYLGTHHTDREAALAVDNVRIFLQEYFDRPWGILAQKLNIPLNEQDLVMAPATQALKDILLAEQAPTYHFDSFDSPDVHFERRQAVVVEAREWRTNWQREARLLKLNARRADLEQRMSSIRQRMTSYQEQLTLLEGQDAELALRIESMALPSEKGKLGAPNIAPTPPDAATGLPGAKAPPFSPAFHDPKNEKPGPIEDPGPE